MNTPEPNTIGQGERPALGDDRSCLELMLRLQPFPCLVVETHTAQAVLSNEEARRMLLDRPGNAAGADVRYAMDAAGGRIEPDQVIPYVIGLDAARRRRRAEVA